jgi:hypothetical protein
MKASNLKLGIIVAAGLFLTADTGYDTASSLVTKGQRTERQQKPSEIRYVCPMHPEVESKTPGACRKCKMTMVKRRVVKAG